MGLDQSLTHEALMKSSEVGFCGVSTVGQARLACWMLSGIVVCSLVASRNLNG